MVNPLLLLLLSSAPGLQDPTQPLRIAPPIEVAGETVAGEPKKGLQLQAIFTGNGLNSVIIDGKLYQAGDKVSSYRLARINADSILLQGQGESVTLRLFPSLSTLSKP